MSGSGEYRDVGRIPGLCQVENAAQHRLYVTTGNVGMPRLRGKFCAMMPFGGSKHAASAIERRFLMPYKATLVDLPDFRLVVSRADEFPSGIKACWDKLESKLSSLKGRKFYGVALREGSELIYYAGLEPVSDAEVASLGFPTMMIKGGKYARAKLFDYSNHTDRIGEIFGELIRDLGMDPHKPMIEYYRSQSELHLLVPLAEPKA